MAFTPTGSNLTIQALAYALGYSSSEAAVTASGNVDLGSIVKRFCGSTHATSSQKYSLPGNEVGGVGLGDWGVDKLEPTTVDALGGVTGTTGTAFVRESDGSGFMWARASNCGHFWTGSGENGETLAGSDTHFTWADTFDGTADGTDFNLNGASNGNYTASYTVTQTDGVESTETLTVSYTYADDYNVSASNYNTQIDKTVQIIDDGEESSPGGGGGGPGGGGAGCLIIGTKVLMSDGSYKNIEDIAINDKVASVNFEFLPDGDKFGNYSDWYENDTNRIIHTTSSIVSNTIDYYYDHLKITDDNDNIIEVTETHPFLVFTEETNDSEHWKYIGNPVCRFKRAGMLTTNDKLVQQDGSKVGIKSIEEIIEEEQMVLFNAEDVDTGIIKVGNNHYIIHNGKGD